VSEYVPPAALRKIGEVAEATELSIKTIRHYDEVGLVQPSARSAGGFRLYTQDDVDRLLTIRRMKPLGFSLEEMAALLGAREVLSDATSPSDDVVAARSTLTRLQAAVRDAADRLERDLRFSRELAGELADLLDGHRH
jgi:DNA-binding transcriptional MerR regulator